MIIDCISDLHGHYPKLEGGDLLIVAGDLTRRDIYEDVLDFHDWFGKQNYKKRIVIAGNHDNSIQKRLNPGFWNYGDYLEDSGTEFEYVDQISSPFPDKNLSIPYPTGRNIPQINHVIKNLKIWGSPWSLRFPGMNPDCMAFTVDTEEELAEKWALISDDVDILVTHSPPFTILDKTIDCRQVGSSSLMAEHIRRFKPALWVFGHIHESYGQDGPFQWNNTKYVNASHVNEHYQPVNKPIRIEF